jgi:hypothetical protein
MTKTARTIKIRVVMSKESCIVDPLSACPDLALEAPGFAPTKAKE